MGYPPFEELFGKAANRPVGLLLDQMVQIMGEREFVERAAAHLLSLVRLQEVIPESLSYFLPMIKDGIFFFLCQLPCSRLREAIICQASLPEGTDEGMRLLKMVLCFPTLHKLGQIIARHPSPGKLRKEWLIRLEEGLYGADAKSQAMIIDDQLDQLGALSQVAVEPRILAEGSVAAVLPFTYGKTGPGWREMGVFKVLKLGVREKLREELEVLEQTAAFLEKRRERYCLHRLRLSTLFNEIRADMAREVDLAAEQENLTEAARVYGRMDRVVIPELLSFCTKKMTALQRLEGVKITDLEAGFTQKADLARLVFETIFCRPFFMQEDLALFHGDPHAGNIMAIPGDDPDTVSIALLDWTLADYISKSQRLYLIELMIGTITGKRSDVASSVAKLAGGATDRRLLRLPSLTELIHDIAEAPEYLEVGPLQRTFLLMEKLTFRGIVFPGELILFRKSFFTLHGVLNDISPGFDMEKILQDFLWGLLARDMPLRLCNCFLPRQDKACRYLTMMSNRDLQYICLYQAIAQWKLNLEAGSLLFQAQLGLYVDYLNYLERSCLSFR